MNRRVIKKAVKKAAPAKRKESNVIVEVMTRGHITPQTVIHNQRVGNIVEVELGAAKVYPRIYSYIVNRENEDMAKIYGEHKNLQVPTTKAKKISGFKVVNNKLVAVTTATK